MQATGKKYLAAPKKRPTVCSRGLLTLTSSAGALDFQCNDPDDGIGEDEPPAGWAGQCDLTANRSFLSTFKSLKAAQWCNGNLKNNTLNGEWNFVKV